ncbi:MAG: hypothetical protein LH629_11850, partial [Ignavibacteria bacterium]|nr:hypothetical protein [Ignavibacteria bacterium]
NTAAENTMNTKLLLMNSLTLNIFLFEFTLQKSFRGYCCNFVPASKPSLVFLFCDSSQQRSPTTNHILLLVDGACPALLRQGGQHQRRREPITQKLFY